MLLAFEEVMGKKEFNSILDMASISYLTESCQTDTGNKVYSYETFTQLQSLLEQKYGSHAGRGVTLRAGRAFFSHGLRIFGNELGLNDLTFRLQPPDIKFIKVLHALSDLFNRATNQNIVLKEIEYKILWSVEHCPWCKERQVDEPVCQFLVGMLQEALYWVSGGKIYNIVEESCSAQGDRTCLIVVDRISLT
jgi:predicted hydrocarbon binding protein